MRIPFIAVAVSLLVTSLGADTRRVSEAEVALQKAVNYLTSIATEGGYLWRYSPDLKTRAGETVATPTQIWIQPPGTPSVGTALLEAHVATGDPGCRAAARAAAHALAAGQLESGGWDYLIDFDPREAMKWYRRTDLGRLSAKDAERRRNTSTYDDNTTQSALRFLMEFAAVDAGDPTVNEALAYGLKKLLAAQYPNGAWPQRYQGLAIDPTEYPVMPARLPKTYQRQYRKGGYSAHYTLNDNAQRDVMGVMLQAWRQFGLTEYRDAAKRGGEFLIRAQLPEPQPVWAQQYNAAMEPAWARSFEPVAVCGGESVGAMQMLLDLHIEFGDAKYLDPIPRALAWYDRSEVRPGVWNRYYELHTNKPIFGDRDGKIYYALDEISKERQTGYGWQGDFGLGRFQRNYAKLKEQGREKLLAARRPKSVSEKEKAKRLKSLDAEVAKVIAALDGEGRWVTPGRVKDRDYEFDQSVETRVFIANLRVLTEYLKLAR